MILETDFLDHWKTRWLVDLLADEMAHTYVMRLWFHCQARKTIYFEGMTGQVLKAVCKYPGDGEKLKKAMVTVGFIVASESDISVPKFAELNSKMVSNWENGKLGGRPRNSENIGEIASDNPTETHTEPVGKVGMVGMEGIDREGGREGTARPPDLEIHSKEVQVVAKASVEAYQIRRYDTPDPKASYYPQVFDEAFKVFDINGPQTALSIYLKTCRAPPTASLPKKATFSDICIAAGLKKRKRHKGESPSTPYHDVTAERLAKERAAQCTESTT